MQFSFWPICLAIFIFTGAANAFQMKACGVYAGEARLIEDKGKTKLVFNESAENQLDVVLASPLSKADAEYLDKKIAVEFRVSKACSHHCEGHLLKIKDLVSPLQETKDFFSTEPKPLRVDRKKKC